MRRLLAAFIVIASYFPILARGQAPVVSDSYIDPSNKNASVNFGNSKALQLQGPGGNVYLSFRFDRLPPGATSSAVTKATLRLFVNNVSTDGQFDVVLVQGAWNESSVTALNSPALGPVVIGNIPVTATTSTGQYLVVDVTSVVKLWLGQSIPNNGLALVPSAGSGIVASFDSKEASTTSHDPQIQIDYIDSSVTANLAGLQSQVNTETLNRQNADVSVLAQSSAYANLQVATESARAQSVEATKANLVGGNLFSGPQSIGLSAIDPGAYIALGGDLGKPSILLWGSTTSQSHGIGIQPAETQFWVPTGGLGHHFSFNKGGQIQPSGVNELMRITDTGRVGIGTIDPQQALDVVGNLRLQGKGNGIIFADGTTQNSAAANSNGTVTSIGSGLGLVGGPITSSGTLSLDTAFTDGRYAQLKAANNIFGGAVTAGSFIGDASGLTNLPVPNLSNLNASNLTSGTVADARLSPNVALRNATNNFTGNQTVNGTLTASGLTTTNGLIDAGLGFVKGSTGIFQNLALHGVVVRDFGEIATDGTIHTTGLIQGGSGVFTGNLSAGDAVVASVTTGGGNLDANGGFVKGSTGIFQNLALHGVVVRDFGEIATDGFIHTSSSIQGAALQVNANDVNNIPQVGQFALRQDGKLSLRFGVGTNPPVEKLTINPDGTINFAAGQIFPGSQADLSNLNASNLSSGTLPDGRLSGAYSSALNFNNASNNFAGTFSGNGNQLTSLNAANLHGTVPDGNLPTNLARIKPVLDGVFQSGVLEIASVYASSSAYLPALIGSNGADSGIGVRGEGSGSAGLGVLAIATSELGNTVGVSGHVFSPTGTAGYFENHAPGGKILSGHGGVGGPEVFSVTSDGAVRATSFSDLNGNPVGSSALPIAYENTSTQSSVGATPTRVLTRTLAPGTYTVFAKARMWNDSSLAASAGCRLSATTADGTLQIGDAQDTGLFPGPGAPGSFAAVVVQQLITLPAQSSGAYPIIGLDCWVDSGQGSARNVSMIITKAVNGDTLPLVASLTVSPVSGTAPLAVAATVSSATRPVSNYEIDFGDGTVVFASTAQHTYTVPGTYVVSGRVTDDSGRTAATPKTITVQ